MQIWTPYLSPSINIFQWLPWPAEKIRAWCFQPLMIRPHLWSLIFWHHPAIFCVLLYLPMFCARSILSLESLPLPSDIGQIPFLPLTCHHLREVSLVATGVLLNNWCAFLFPPLTLATFYCDYLSKCVFYCHYLHQCLYQCLCMYVNICVPERVLSLRGREESGLLFHSNPPGGTRAYFLGWPARFELPWAVKKIAEWMRSSGGSAWVSLVSDHWLHFGPSPFTSNIVSKLNQDIYIKYLNFPGKIVLKPWGKQPEHTFGASSFSSERNASLLWSLRTATDFFTQNCPI